MPTDRIELHRSGPGRSPPGARPEALTLMICKQVLGKSKHNLNCGFLSRNRLIVEAFFFLGFGQFHFLSVWILVEIVVPLLRNCRDVAVLLTPFPLLLQCQWILQRTFVIVLHREKTLQSPATFVHIHIASLA